MTNNIKQLANFLLENGISYPLNDKPINRMQMSYPPKNFPTKNLPVKKVMAASQNQPFTSNENLKKCQTLNDLKKIIENFNGCELKKTARNTVFSDGNPSSKIMIIGEAPGAEEDLQGKPFVGQSGILLDKALACIGLDRSKFYIANILPWRPPANRTPSSDEIALCLPFIKKHIALLKPNFLLLLGGVAAKSILNSNDGIMKIRGKWVPYYCEDDTIIQTIATFHPAYLLRSPGQKSLFWQDLLKLKIAL